MDCKLHNMLTLVIILVPRLLSLHYCWAVPLSRRVTRRVASSIALRSRSRYVRWGRGSLRCCGLSVVAAVVVVLFRGWRCDRQATTRPIALRPSHGLMIGGQRAASQSAAESAAAAETVAEVAAEPPQCKAFSIS